MWPRGRVTFSFGRGLRIVMKKINKNTHLEGPDVDFAKSWEYTRTYKNR